MQIQNPFYIIILLFLFNTGDGSALLMYGNSNGSDTIHGTGGHSADVTEIKQIVVNLTTEMENLKRHTDIIPALKQNLTVLCEEKKLLQNRVFFLEAELNKLNASKSPSNEELMAYLRSTKQIVQTLAANEEYDKNLTKQLNEAKNDIAICGKQNKNFTKRLDEVVNNLVINEKQDKNLTHRLNEVENILVKYDKQGKNVTQQLNEIRHVLNTNEDYDKNLTLQLTDSVNNLHDIRVQMRYTSLSLMDVHSKTDKLNTTLTRNLDDQIRDVYGQITNMTISTKNVAFTVGVTSASSTWSSGTLVFDRIVYNIGGGYDSRTGVFAAPVDGHFVFFVNVQNNDGSEIYTHLVLNGSTKITTLGNGAYKAGPNLAVLRLQKGDRVWVKHWFGIGYYTNSDAPVTTFTGFLI